MTESKAARPVERRQRDALFRLLVESVRDYAIFLLDRDGYILSWNEGAHRLKGYDAEEIIGQHFSIFYPPQEVRRGKPEYGLKVAADEGRWEEEGWRVRKDGSRFWASVVITALRANGDLIGFAKVTRDLTERKRAEEARSQLLVLEQAARSETETALEQLRAIQSLTETALAHLDLDELLESLLDQIGDMLVADGVAILLLEEDMLVVHAARGLEKDLERGQRMSPDSGLAGRIVAGGRPIVLGDMEGVERLEAGAQARVGTPLTVQGEVIGALLIAVSRHRRFSEGEVRFLQSVGDQVALAIDHARLVETARAARQETEIAEATVRARDAFLSIAAHELKTPITSLRIAAQTLRRRLDRGGPLEPHTLQHAVGTVEQQSMRLSRLIAQLLETARLQESRLGLERAPVDLTELMAGLVEQAQAQTSRHDLVLTAPERLWAQVDAGRLEQVVTNLLDNAIKFSPDGGQIDIRLGQPTPETVRLSVRDHGLGVALEHRPHLFERFYQAHGRDYRSGMGLGLAISREIVERHGGQIAVEFPPDGGTCFVVDLPVEGGEAVRGGTA